MPASMAKLPTIDERCVQPYGRLWTPDPRYMAPELRRGPCGTCGAPVTAFDQRFLHAGVYFHNDSRCVPTGCREFLGDCGFCGLPVEFPLAHCRVAGVYYHGDLDFAHSCWRRMDRARNGCRSDGEASADDDSGESDDGKKEESVDNNKRNETGKRLAEDHSPTARAPKRAKKALE